MFVKFYVEKTKFYFIAHVYISIASPLFRFIFSLKRVCSVCMNVVNNNTQM